MRSWACQSFTFKWVNAVPFIWFHCFHVQTSFICVHLSLSILSSCLVFILDWICTKKCKCDRSPNLQIYTVIYMVVGKKNVFKLHPTSQRSNSKHLPFKFQNGELVLIINFKWEAWVIGLTFPGEPHRSASAAPSSGGLLVVLVWQRCWLPARSPSTPTPPVSHSFLTLTFISVFSMKMLKPPLHQQPPPCYHPPPPPPPPSLFYDSIPPILQVLHLMNKMNLPCPFGPVTARPPMVSPRTRLRDREREDNDLDNWLIHFT